MQLSHIASLTGLFAALCTTPAAAQTFSSLPGQGPLENKTCNYITGPAVRPGNVPVNPDQAVEKARAIANGWASIMGNDCRVRSYVVDAQGNATAQDDTAPARQMRQQAAARPPSPQATSPAPTTQAAPQAASTAPTVITGWSTIPGFLPLQIDPASIRLTYVPIPSSGAWREEGCTINGVKIAINAGLILDNRTFWQVGQKCALHPLVTVTRDAAQPLNGPATRFDTATELVTALYKMQSNAGGQAAFAKLDAALRGEAIPPIFPAGAFIQTYPGRMVVVDESIASGIFLLKGFAGYTDTRTAMLLPAPAPTSTATALTGEWWHQPGLLPTSPQGNITAAGRDAAGNCRITINGQQVAAVAPDRLIIPDNTRLMYVDSKCDVKLVFNVPAEKGSPEPPISTAGGGFRNPGNIILPGKPNVNVLFQPAVNAEISAARVLTMLNALTASQTAATAATATAVSRAFMAARIVVLGAGGYVIYKAIESLNEVAAESALRMAETPSGTYEKHLTRPIDDRAEELSKKRDPDGRARGTCSADMISDVIHGQQEEACTGAKDCRPSMSQNEMRGHLFKNALCLKYRLNIMDMCFAGGNTSHRNEAGKVLDKVRNCQKLIQ